MAYGSESPIFRCWTRIIAACRNNAMAHGYILKMEMLTLSIREWLLIRSTGGISGTESSTGAIPGWLRMYTGEASNENGTWYYQNGRIPFNLTGMVLTDKEWRYVRNGRIITDYTGMASNPVDWWYFRNGELDWGYTGMAQNENGWWYYE